jgi:hypothetical protein
MYENSKMRHVGTLPGMGQWGTKEIYGGAEFNYDIL